MAEDELVEVGLELRATDAMGRSEERLLHVPHRSIGERDDVGCALPDVSLFRGLVGVADFRKGSKPGILSLTIVEPTSMLRSANSVIVSCVKSGITSMRTGPEPVPRRSTATITSVTLRPLSWRLPRSPACGPLIHV